MNEAKLKILVIDDDELFQSMLNQALIKFGYDVIPAESGETALSIYFERADEISLVLLDMGFPGMSGLSGFRRLRAINGQVKVIVVTEDVEQADVDQVLAEGALGVLNKPFLLEALSTLIEQLLKD